MKCHRREVALVAIRGDVDKEHPSLVAALARAGEDVGLAVGIAELFAGDIDFYRDLQPGDSIEVVFEQVLREGARVAYGDIVAARLINAGRCCGVPLPAGRRQPAYYDDTGLSLKRFFLASPLKFEPRITSGFSMRRFHPILGIAGRTSAPTSAPLRRARRRHRRGTVVRRATAPAAATRSRCATPGLREPLPAPVRLRARRPRRRARAQGQVIGRVGATGLATGAHLHYELMRNGAHVNPVAEQKRNPPGEADRAGRADGVRRGPCGRWIRRFVGAVAPVSAN